MKNLRKILFLCGIVIFIACSCEKEDQVSQEKKFYYAFDKKIYLIPKNNTLIVKYIEGIDENNEEIYLKNYSPDVNVAWIHSLVAEVTAISEESKNDLMLILKQKEEVYTCQPFYTTENGLEMGVTDEILVNFLPDISIAKQDSLQEKYQTILVKETDLYRNYQVSKGGDALEIANEYYESGLTKYSTPNFLSKIVFF
jgi:hypothetical protein